MTNLQEKYEEQGYLYAKGRYPKTIAAGLTAFVLGMVSSIFGPTLVPLEHLFSTDTATIGLAMAFNAGGCLLGSFLSGVFFDRINSELQLAVTCLLEGVSVMAATYSPTIHGFTAFMTVQGITRGCLDTGCTAYLLVLWAGHRSKDSILQSLHLMWSVGSALAPFMIAFFLADVSQVIPEGEASVTLYGLDQMDMSNYSLSNGFVNLAANESNNADTLDLAGNITADIVGVQQGYLFIGSFPLFNSACFFILFFLNGCTVSKIEKLPAATKSKHISSEEQLKSQKSCFNITFLLLLFIFGILYALVEVIPGNFLSAFAIKGFDWSVGQGAVLISVLWASQGAGRLISVPASFCTPASVILAISFSLITGGSFVMLLAPYWGMPGLIGAVVLLGLGIGPIFAAELCWASNYIRVTAFATGITFIGGGIGKMLGAIGIGYAIEALGHMCIPYTLVTSSVLFVALFIVMNVFVRCCSETKSEEKQIKEEDLGYTQSLLRV